FPNLPIPNRQVGKYAATVCRPRGAAMIPDVRMRGFRDRAEVEDVVRLLDERLARLPAEAIGVAAAADRVLAADIVSEVNVPAFDRAAMDGFALRGNDTFGASDYNPLELTVLGESFPARPF